MSFCLHCGNSLTGYVSCSDQLGQALNRLFTPQLHPGTEAQPTGPGKLFDSLLYLGKSRNYNDQVAFHLLYQVFVLMTRHDREENWPKLEQMWVEAQRRTAEAARMNN